MNKPVCILLGVAAASVLAAFPARSEGVARAKLPPHLRATADQFLEKYDDPVGRRMLLEPELARARANLEGFDQERKLDATTFEKLLQLEAGYQVDVRAIQYRCAAYPPCTGYPDSVRWDRHMEAIDALIGQSGYDHMQSWTRSIPARRMVKSLSRQLPTTLQMTTAQSNALLDELADARRLYIYGYSEIGQEFAAYIGGSGLEVLYYRDARAGDQRMASARAYSQRIRDVAATVLNGRQFAIFARMQDQALVELQRYLVNHGAPARAGS